MGSSDDDRVPYIGHDEFRAGLPAGSPDFIRADDIMLVAEEAVEKQRKKRR